MSGMPSSLRSFGVGKRVAFGFFAGSWRTSEREDILTFLEGEEFLTFCQARRTRQREWTGPEGSSERFFDAAW